MIRGTTPTLKFTLPFDTDTVESMSIAFAQKQSPQALEPTFLFEKTLEHCTIKDGVIYCDLTEEDTLSLSSDYNAEIQIRLKYQGKVVASDIMTASVGRILREGVLE